MWVYSLPPLKTKRHANAIPNLFLELKLSEGVDKTLSQVDVGGNQCFVTVLEIGAKNRHSIGGNFEADVLGGCGEIFASPGEVA